MRSGHLEQQGKPGRTMCRIEEFVVKEQVCLCEYGRKEAKEERCSVSYMYMCLAVQKLCVCECGCVCGSLSSDFFGRRLWMTDKLPWCSFFLRLLNASPRAEI